MEESPVTTTLTVNNNPEDGGGEEPLPSTPAAADSDVEAGRLQDAPSDGNEVTDEPEQQRQSSQQRSSFEVEQAS
jgi:hypothetical protein